MLFLAGGARTALPSEPLEVHKLITGPALICKPVDEVLALGCPLVLLQHCLAVQGRLDSGRGGGCLICSHSFSGGVVRRLAAQLEVAELPVRGIVLLDYRSVPCTMKDPIGPGVSGLLLRNLN